MLRALWVALPVLSVGAAAIHVSVIREHLEEYWPFSLFFVVVAVLQAAWAVLVLVRPSPRILLAGAVGSALLALTWLASRTTGLPIGPDRGTPDPVGLADSLATVCELLAVAVVAALLRAPADERSRSRPPLGGSAWIVSVGAASLAAAGLVAAAGAAVSRRAFSSGGARLVGQHFFHFVFLGGALIVFAAYLVVDVRRNGALSFSWRLRPEPRDPGRTGSRSLGDAEG